MRRFRPSIVRSVTTSALLVTAAVVLTACGGGSGSSGGSGSTKASTSGGGASTTGRVANASKTSTGEEAVARKYVTAVFIDHDKGAALDLVTPDLRSSAGGAIDNQLRDIKGSGPYVIGTVTHDGHEYVVQAINDETPSHFFSFEVHVTIEQHGGHAQVGNYTAKDFDPNKPVAREGKNPAFSCTPGFVVDYVPVSAKSKAIAGTPVPKLDLDAKDVKAPGDSAFADWALTYVASSDLPEGPTEAMAECYAKYVTAHGWVANERQHADSSIGPGTDKLLTSQRTFYPAGKKYQNSNMLFVQFASKAQTVDKVSGQLQVILQPNGHLAELPPLPRR